MTTGAPGKTAVGETILGVGEDQASFQLPYQTFDAPKIEVPPVGEYLRRSFSADQDWLKRVYMKKGTISDYEKLAAGALKNWWHKDAKVLLKNSYYLQTGPQVSPGFLSALQQHESPEGQWDMLGRIARSDVGARGLWQIMPATAKSLSKRYLGDETLLHPDDPADNATLAVLHLIDSMNLIRNKLGRQPSMKEVLAHYNNGAKGLRQVLANGHISPQTRRHYESVMEIFTSRPVSSLLPSEIEMIRADEKYGYRWLDPEWKKAYNARKKRS